MFFVMVIMSLNLLSCNDDGDEPNPEGEKIKGCDPALIGVWVGTKYTYDYYESYSFAEDGTFTIRHDFAGNPSSPNNSNGYKTTYTGTYAAQNGTIEAIFISGVYRETGNNHDYTFDNTPKRTYYSIKGDTLELSLGVPERDVPMNDVFIKTSSTPEK